MPKTNRTKKQHYIAQGIIKQFFDSNNIYEKNAQTQKIYKVSVEDTMCMNNAYELTFLKDNFLEDLFAGSIDVDSSNLINKLKELLEECKYEEAKNYIYKGIRIFLINYYKSITSLIHLSDDLSKKEQSSIVRMIEKIFDVNYIDRIAEILCSKYDLYFITSKNGNFLLSDQFISTCSLKFNGRFINISNREIGLKDTMVLLPISKKYYVLLINGNLPDILNLSNGKVNVLSSEAEEKINDIIYNNSYEKCISIRKDILEITKKHNSTYGDSMASVVFKSGYSNSYKVKQEVFFYDDEYEMYEYYDSMKWATQEFKECKVNDLCPCKSQKKYKKCCKNKVDRCNRILNTIHYNQKSILIDNELGFEEPILLPQYKNNEINRIINNIKKDN